MVEYSIGFCYGIIISDNQRIAIEELFPDENSLDDFIDSYMRQINSWTGGDWFLGVYTEKSKEIINLTEIRWDKAILEEFEMKLSEYGITNLINWHPQKYVIQFCY